VLYRVLSVTLAAVGGEEIDACTFGKVLLRLSPLRLLLRLLGHYRRNGYNKRRNGQDHACSGHSFAVRSRAVRGRKGYMLHAKFSR
jgi:hypothetical protein